MAESVMIWNIREIFAPGVSKPAEIVEMASKRTSVATDGINSTRGGQAAFVLAHNENVDCHIQQQFEGQR